MVRLQNNIEIVAGKKRLCIYDLNTGKLYSLDREDLDILERILENGDISALQSDTGRYLLEAGILVEEAQLLPKAAWTNPGFHVNFAWLEITQNCNLLCRHCYEGSSRRECKPEMSFEHFTLAVDALVKAGVDGIQLVGGEPLMHSQIRRMIDYVAGKFSYIEIYTNGTLLTEELLNQIAGYGMTLALSYYSETPELHDRVTCTKGSFRLTHRHIQEAVAKGIPIRLAAVEMKDVPGFQLTSFPVSFRTDLPRLTGRADLSLYSRDMLRRKLITKDTFARPISPEEFYKNRVLHNCFGEKLYIDSHLDLYPCVMERRVTYGNLLEANLATLLHSRFASMTKDAIEGCKDCEYRYACYDCRCDANGAPFDGKPWYCTYDPAKGIWLETEAFINRLLGPE